MSKKIKIGLVFGGRSGEHEVSVRSAKSIYEALDKSKYEVSLLGVDKLGGWHKMEQKWLPQGSEMKSLPSGERRLIVQEQHIDVYVPIIHGSYGEDGCLQGMLEMGDKPYVGAGVLGSALGMDKDVQKRLLMQSGISVAKFQVIKRLDDLEMKNLIFPVFVKPANGGSSVGVSKCKSVSNLKEAIKKAFLYDAKVLIEETVVGREIEVSVLGNQRPIASLPGEIIPVGHEFYDYEAKYIDDNGARLEAPAKNLGKKKIKEIQKLAIKTFKILEGSGMARVDMFLKKDGQILINEINTLPGFTSISMYPKLWEVSGLPFPKLLDKLIELAIRRYSDKKNSAIDL